MSAAVKSQEQPEVKAVNRGRFQKGPDPRHHKFTRNECSTGFWNAAESIICRYPGAIMSDGRHIVVNFMKSRKREVIN
jgi:hypothetical protein